MHDCALNAIIMSGSKMRTADADEVFLELNNGIFFLLF